MQRLNYTSILAQMILAQMILTLIPATVFAQEKPRTLSVEGSATVNIKPDQLVFSLNIVGNGANQKEASKIYREKKQSFLTTFNVMKIKGLSVTSTAKTISAQPAGGGMGGGVFAPAMGGGFGGGGIAIPVAPAAASNQPVFVSELINMKIEKIDVMDESELDELIALINKEATKIGLTPPVSYSTSASDTKQAKAKAFEKAFEKAKSQAELFAKLANGKVGKVISVSNVTQPFAGQVYSPYAFPGAVTAAFGISSKTPVNANIKVVFELID